VVPAVSGQGPSARTAALEALRHVDSGAGFLRDELHALFDRLRLAPRDRALATQLAAGTLRHRRTLGLVLGHVRGAAGRAGSIQPALREVLELGAFQLLFLDRVPAYAAVHEAVEAARRASRGPRGAKSSGFVNAMLRGVQRLVAGRQTEGAPARDALPHPEGGVVRLREPVLPDPADGLAPYLGAAYSYPDWLVARWLAALGDRTEDVCRWGNRRPRVFARINPSASGAAEAGPGAGSEALAALPAGPRPGCVDLSGLAAEALEALLAAGAVTVQDPSAMAPVEALAPVPGETVLDLCASPGTKTTQIAEALGGRGCLVACDRSEAKLDPLRRVVASRALANVHVCLAQEADAAAPPGGFDAALVDAPCSNTGVLARRPEARWRLRPDDLAELPTVQGRLLERAAGLVRPGGRLVYATCSLQPEENEGVVHAFLGAHADWRQGPSELVRPGPDGDGAFWALLGRAPAGA